MPAGVPDPEDRRARAQRGGAGRTQGRRASPDRTASGGRADREKAAGRGKGATPDARRGRKPPPGVQGRGGGAGYQGRTRDRDAQRSTNRDGGGADRGSSRSGTRSGGFEGRTRKSFGPPVNAEEARSPKSWGSLARKGTRQLNVEGPSPASQAWREAVARSRTPEGLAEAPDAWEAEEVWVRDDGPAPNDRSARTTGRSRRPSKEAASAPERDDPAKGGRKPKSLPPEVQSELAESVTGKAVVLRLQQRMTDATGAFERERYGDAARMLRPLAEQAPGAAAVRELYGLALYRLGRWEAAIKELEAFRSLSPDSVDQHPTLADCYRAKKRWRKVDELWEALRTASPAPDLLAEGRLVYAGSLAERGRMGEAIEVLERAKTSQRKPRADHLRTWYALADLYERAGEVPRARELFRRVASFDVDLYDTAERLRAIGG